VTESDLNFFDGDNLPVAERHLNRRWFGAMLGRIAPLPVPTG
jgi:hypothetical protein